MTSSALASILNDMLSQPRLEALGVSNCFVTFFDFKKNVNRFNKLVPRPADADEVVRGMVAVLLGARGVDEASLVKAYLMHIEGLADDANAASNVVDAMESYGVEGAFERLLKSSTGYEGDLSAGRAFAAHVLVSAACMTMPEPLLAGLERVGSSEFALHCFVIVRKWLDSQDQDDKRSLYKMCRLVEEDLSLGQRFRSTPIVQLWESDVFPAIDEAILSDLLQALSQSLDRCSEAKRVVQVRSSTAWWSFMRPYYDCVLHASEILGFRHDHADSFEGKSSVDVWRCYVSSWWRIDSAYRAFTQAVASCEASGLPALRSGVHELAQRVEDAYAHWFLPKCNAAWVAASKKSWETGGHIEGLPLQQRFYDNVVLEEIFYTSHVMVIVSDALRFEVARQIASELERNSRAKADVSAMQSTFPSTTSFGMAALLPHHSLEFSHATGLVSVDGMPTESLQDKQAVLQKSAGLKTAIRFKDLMGMSRAERKGFVSGNTIVYVYHNTIEAAGSDEASRLSVFDGCDKAVEEIAALARSAVSGLGVGRVIITSDHGFQYASQGFPEIDLESSCGVSDPAEHVGCRFVVAGPDAESEAFVRVGMQEADGASCTWWTPRDLAAVNGCGSKNFLHGGMSLQELCIPVVRFRKLRSNSKELAQQKHAQIRVINRCRRITSRVFFMDLFQEEPVSEKVAPYDYDLVFIDSAGNEVSDRCLVHADSESANDADRRIKARFVLKANVRFSKQEKYFLMAADVGTYDMCWEEEFQIEVEPACVVDF